MHRTIIPFLFLLFLTSTLFSQEKVSYKNLKSVRQDGKFIRFQVEDFKPKKSKNNHNKSKTYYWFKSQSILSTQGGSSGLLLHGIYEQFHTNKQLAIKGSFKNGLKHGDWNYWNKEGKLIKEEFWRRGGQKKSAIEYTINGEIKKETNYRKNEIVYHSNNKRITTNLDSSQVKIFESYPNGNKKMISHFKNGNLHGKQIEFDKNGDIHKLENYKEGVLHGKYAIRDSIEQNYKNGELHGKQIINDSITRYFKNGEETTPFLKRIFQKKEQDSTKINEEKKEDNEDQKSKKLKRKNQGTKPKDAV